MIKLKLSTHVSYPWKNFNNRIFSRDYFYLLDGIHITIENFLKELSNNFDFYSYQKYKYIGLASYDQLTRKYLDSYNIKSVISKKYLEYVKIDNNEFDFIC